MWGLLSSPHDDNHAETYLGWQSLKHLQIYFSQILREFYQKVRITSLCKDHCVTQKYPKAYCCGIL